MNSKIACAGGLALLLSCAVGKADFKYTQTSKMTGGALAGVMKVMGHFSKQAREPMTSTSYFKGNRMRRDSADGTVQIIDLDAQRIIEVNTKRQSYSVMTFDQMRQAMQAMQERMQQGMQKQKEQPNAPQVQMKINVIPTQQTQQLLCQTAQEMKIVADMVMQGQDPNHPEAGTQSATMRMGIDSWVAPGVSGYSEAQQFYKRMATLLNWTPNQVPMMDPRMTKAMVDLAKSGKLPSGLPLLQTVSFGMAGVPPSGNGASPANSGSQTQSEPPPSEPSSAQGVAAKALGGMFGGFGRFGHKKQQQDASQTTSSGSAPPQGATSSQPGTADLMEMTIQVTSFSTDPVDGSLFAVPAGYRQVEPNMKNPYAPPR
jgi:hypothetical protein